MTLPEWKDRRVERENTYKVLNNKDGTITLMPVPGEIYEPGTPLNALNLNKINSQLSDNTHKSNINADNINSIQTQVNSIASGSPKGVYPTVSDLRSAFPNGNSNIYVVSEDGNWYYWDNDWTNGGVYQSTAIGNKTVNENNLTFTVDGLNKFNKITSIIGHYVDWVTGELIENSGYIASDFISVGDNQTYFINYKIRSVVFYDENKDFISSLQNIKEYNSFNTPLNSGYMRVTIYVDDNNINDFQIQLNNPSFKKRYENSVIKSSNIEKLSITEENTNFFVRSNKNLIDTNKFVNRRYLNPNNGETLNDMTYTYNISDFVLVEEEESYVFNVDVRSLVYFDKNRTFHSGISETIKSGTPIVIPSGVKFLRANLDETYELIQFEKGERITSFEPFYILKPSVYNTLSSKWKNKTFISLGDSITWQDGKPYEQGSSIGKISRGYQTIMKEKLGFSDYLNVGVSGRPMANGTPNGEGTNATGKKQVYKDFDLVTIASGTNDFKLNVPLGNIGKIGDVNFDTNTFYGAYRDLIEHILEEKPTIRIVLFTPLQRDNGNYNSWNTVNGAGHSLDDYTNAIKEIAKMYSLPVCDVNANSGFNKFNLSTYTLDGLHPNDLGYERMGGYVSNFICNIGL